MKIEESSGTRTWISAARVKDANHSASRDLIEPTYLSELRTCQWLGERLLLLGCWAGNRSHETHDAMKDEWVFQFSRIGWSYHIPADLVVGDPDSRYGDPGSNPTGGGILYLWICVYKTKISMRCTKIHIFPDGGTDQGAYHYWIYSGVIAHRYCNRGLLPRPDHCPAHGHSPAQMTYDKT